MGRSIIQIGYQLAPLLQQIITKRHIGIIFIKAVQVFTDDNCRIHARIYVFGKFNKCRYKDIHLILDSIPVIFQKLLVICDRVLPIHRLYLHITDRQIRIIRCGVSDPTLSDLVFKDGVLLTEFLFGSFPA